MAIVKPFRALRYNEKKFPVPPVAPPYDIINEADREKMASDEYNMINLDKPGSKDDVDKYKKAAQRLGKWKEEGVLINDEKPSFYLYEQEFKNPETGKVMKRRGFFAALLIEEPYEKHIFPHEKTLSAPKADRLSLMRETKANLSPVFGLYDDPENKAEAVFDKVAAAEKKVYETYVDSDGTKHSLWIIDDESDIEELENILAPCNMIIADGHHRYATALNYAKERGSNFDGSNGYDYVLVALVNFNDSGLIILPTHRLIGFEFDKEVVLSKLEKYFDIESVSRDEMERRLFLKKGCSLIGFSLKGEDYLLLLKSGANLSGIIPDSKSQTWKRLEVTLLYYLILKHILEIDDKTFQEKINYTHSFAETYELVDSGEFYGAFLVPSCAKEEIESVTLDREVMPQKSTYFFPKIFAGFVIYEH